MDENLREATEFPEKNETTAAEADEPKTKSIHFKVSAYDPRGIEQWLSERAAEGKLLLRGDEFVIGEPCECRYHLEPALDDADPDKRTRATLNPNATRTTPRWAGTMSAGRRTASFISGAEV